jgi:cytochrome c biogenesis protein CcmG/thiol:disulfide interchange protein DsbE
MVGKKLNSSQIDSLTENILIENSFILINFWASWCLPCRKEHKHLLELKTNNKLTLVGINYKDKKKTASKFLKDLGNPYEYLKNDIEGKISVLFGIYGIPESILIDNNLKIIKKFIGPLNEKDYEEIINILN